MAVLQMVHDVEPADKLRSEVGTVDDIDVFNNQVLVAVYRRSNEATLGGKKFILTDQTTGEDRFQSKVGLILKLGPDAFVDETGKWFRGANINVGDWVVFRSSDGWNLTILPAGAVTHSKPDMGLCKLIDDTAIRGRIPHPDRVW